MKIEQLIVKNSNSAGQIQEFIKKDHDLCFVFSGPSHLRDFQTEKTFSEAIFPMVGCSTAGEIHSDGIADDSIVLTSVKFEKGSYIKTASGRILNSKDSASAGKEIAQNLKNPQLRLVFVLGTGVNINGSELIRGLSESLGAEVVVTGGLAGDNGEFKKTHTLLNGKISDDTAVAIGFYGDELKIGYGSQGGWKPFGPVRKITRVEGNVLYELDGESALGVYENYLGDKAKELPASGLLYPFAIVESETQEAGLIRTILNIDKENGSLFLAGDVPEGGLLRLMHTGSDGLISGAEDAAEKTRSRSNSGETPGLALLVSCVGRKLVMGQDTDEEVDAVKDILPDGTVIAGFYSYGEISPFEKTTNSVLHNQTMTVTFITE